MHRFFLSFLFLLCLTLSSCESLYSAISGQKTEIAQINQSDTATVNGVLGKKFYKKFTKFHTEHPEVKHLVLQDIPGSLNDEWNIKSCQYLYDNCFHTIVTDSSSIASGGVDLFMSGNQRTVILGAKIGVHSWRDLKQDGSEYPRDSEEHVLFLDFYPKIDVDTAFYWYTLRASPAETVHWMTPSEIQEYGLNREAKEGKCP